MSDNQKKFSLTRQDGQLFYRDGKETSLVPVRIFLVAPLSAGTSVISIMHAKQKKELVLLQSLDGLDEESRDILEEEIRYKYFFPEITKVNEISIYLGGYYWDVMTDRGAKKFLLKSPVTSVRWLTEQRLLLTDTDGLHYEIPDILALDHKSQKSLAASI